MLPIVIAGRYRGPAKATPTTAQQKPNARLDEWRRVAAARSVGNTGGFSR